MIEKVIRLMDWLILIMIVGKCISWTVWPEDIVGTKELALLVVFMLWQKWMDEK